MKLSRPSSVRYAILAASAGAVLGGGALVLQQTGPASSGHAAPAGASAQDAAISTSACNKIHKRLRAGKDVAVGTALKCDQREFAALEKKRQAGGIEQVELSATCKAVNERLADADRTVQKDLATACRTRELFAFDTDASNEVGSADRRTSMCIGKKKLDRSEKRVPAFEKNACSDKPFGRRPLPVPEVAAPPTPAPTTNEPTPTPTVPAAPSPTTPTFDLATCTPIEQALVNKDSFDFNSQVAVQCAKAEQDPNGDGRPDRPAQICFDVDVRAIKGDLDMPVDLVLECRTQLALQRTPLGSTQQDTPTSICRAAREQQKNNIHVDDQLVAACAGEPA